MTALGRLDGDEQVMLKLTHPELVEHPKVLRVVALSGGYTLDDANASLARNHGVVASFHRALTVGLAVQQNQADFDAALDAAIGSIYEASMT